MHSRPSTRIFTALLLAAGCCSSHQPGDNCDSGNPCAGGLVCLLHVCNSPACGAPCGAMEYCDPDGLCTALPSLDTGTFCNTNRDCHSGYCDASSHTCGVPHTPGGARCTADAQCPDHYCYAGYCQ